MSQVKGELPLGFLRWAAERLCSKRTRELVLLPLLADLQFEHARERRAWARGVARVTGTAAFWQAWLTCGGVEAGRRLIAWGGGAPEERRAAGRLLAWVGLSVCAASALSVSTWFWTAPWSAGVPLGILALALPATLLVALPVGMLFGALLAGAGRGRGLERGELAVSLLAALGMFVLASWVAPTANQALRERTVEALFPGAPPPARGDRELTLGELGAEAVRRRALGRLEEAARLEVEWHKKPAMAASCVALTLCATALGRRVRRAWTRHLLAVLVVSSVFALWSVGEREADAGRLLPMVALWGPVVLVFLGSWWALKSAPERPPAPETA